MFEVADDDFWVPSYFANPIHSLQEEIKGSASFFAIDNYAEGHMSIPRVWGKYCDMLKPFQLCNKSLINQALSGPHWQNIRGIELFFIR